MRFRKTRRFNKEFEALPSEIKKIAKDKFQRFFTGDLHHPSLQVSKLPGTELYYGRITRDYRFVFKIEGDLCIALGIGPHSILDQFR